MKTVSTLLLATGFLCLTGCAPATPTTEPVTTSSSAQQQAPTAMQRLMSLPLPQGWTRIESPENRIVSFNPPSEYESLKNDDISDDSFMARVLPSICDETFANAEVKMNWGENVPAQYKPTVFRVNGTDVGYTWSAFDGVAGGATEPGYRHWCIHQTQPGMDIDVSATRTNEQVKRFIEETFIPLWLQQNSES